MSPTKNLNVTNWDRRGLAAGRAAVDCLVR